MTSQEHSQAYIKASEIRSSGRAVRPRDAATLILVRHDGPQPVILMGKRSAGHAFMPNKFVFPGGKVDRADSCLRPDYDLNPAVLKRLQTGVTEVRARAIAMAALRETYEETGLVLGESASPSLATRSPAWRDYLRHGINPRLDTLHYIARAITPPYRNRRFDARFFMADADIVQRESAGFSAATGELLELHWFTLEEAKLLELPNITRLVLAEVERRLNDGHHPADSGPFVYHRHGKAVLGQRI